MQDSLKILLIDDHALFRDGLRLVFEELEPDADLLEASSFEAAQEYLDAHPDLGLVLLDLGLPGIGQMQALNLIRQQMPGTPIVVLSGQDEPWVVEQALSQGAKGYIPKTASASIMLQALKLVLSGGTYIPPEILKRKAAPGGPDTLDELRNHLTLRQCEVLQQMGAGKSNKTIARELDLSESTVRAHVAAILKAFDVHNRTQAIQFAVQKNWLKL